MSRELLARAWQAGAGPGDGPLTIDLDSTICETYGLAKEGARHHGYTGARGYHPLLAIAAGTGEVLMSRLREGRANTARGAAHFLRETVGRVRYGGARGQLTVRADSGFYAHTVVCRLPGRWMSASLSPSASASQPAGSRSRRYQRRTGLPFPTGWTAPPMSPRRLTLPFQSEAGRRAGAAHRPAGEADARFPAGPLRLLQLSWFHHRPGRGDARTGGRPSPPRRDRECHPRPQARCGVEPSPLGPLRRQRRLAGGTGDGPQHRPLDSAHRSGRAGGDHQDPPAAVLLPGRTDHLLGTPPHPASATALALGNPVQSRPGTAASDSTPSLTAPVRN